MDHIDNLEEILTNQLKQLLNNNDDTVNNISKFKNKHILVISGGSIKGIAALGALHALYELNYLQNINTYAGSSIGALICLLLNLGYIPKDLYDFSMRVDLSKLKSINFNNMFDKFGLDDGRKFEILITQLLTAKGFNNNITFKELYEKTKKKLIMTATCVNDKKVCYHSVDTVPNMSVVKAIRMTISVPIYFTPVLDDNKHYIDGACIDNYPIKLFEDKLDEVIGIYLCDIRCQTEHMKDIETYFVNLMQSLLEGIFCNSIKGYEKYTIKIPLEKCNIMNMDINNEQKTELFNIGYKTVKNFGNP